VSEQQDVIADVDTTVDAPTVTSAKKRGERKTREGMVVSDKMDKTIVVELEDRVKHPRYSKVIRRTTKVKAHDENGTAGIGDRVLLAETRPLSATKRWRLVQVLERAQ
jgi:small subunit ribosomal protein S17